MFRLVAIFLVTFSVLHIGLNDIHCDFDEDSEFQVRDGVGGHAHETEPNPVHASHHFHLEHFGHTSVILHAQILPMIPNSILLTVHHTFTIRSYRTFQTQNFRPPIFS